jgi:WS/DGAT/MGAT family acyltransferase
MKQLTSQDAQLLLAEARQVPNNVGVILLLRPGARGSRPDFATLVEHVRGRLHLSPVFRRRLERVLLDLDYPYWIDDQSFDLDFHIDYTALPRPGSWRQFTRLVSRYQYRPMDLQRPLWEVLMVDGLNSIEGMPRGSFALILKSHHAAIDGVSSVRFFMSLCDLDPSGTPALIDAPATEPVNTAPQARQVFARAVASNVRNPVDLVASLGRAAPSLLPLAYRKLRGDEGSARHGVPDTRFNRPVSRRKQFDACWFPLDDFKRIKARVDGATINDVVLAVCGGTLRRYLRAQRELPKESLVACIAINDRPKGGAAPEAGNRVSAMVVPLYTDLVKPYQRLAAISRETHRLKDDKPGVAAQLMEIGRHLPPFGMALAARLAMRANAAGRLCNVLVSNVPGPAAALYVAGAQCMHYLGVVPIADGLGLCIGTPSYHGEIAFNVMSTVEMIPDMDRFIRCIEESVRELLDGSGRAPPIRQGGRDLRLRKIPTRHAKNRAQPGKQSRNRVGGPARRTAGSHA